MKCPYCTKEIYALTGLQEAQKFEKHLIKCKKNPKRRIVLDEDGNKINVTSSNLKEALEVRAESGQ